MYGPDEHREALNSIGRHARDIESACISIGVTRVDLHVDDAAKTSEAREHLRAASLLLVRAAKACDEAVAALPTPLARRDTAADFRALHGGTLVDRGDAA